MSDPQLKEGYENKAKSELAKAKELDPNVNTSQTAVSNKAWQLAYDSALSQQGANMGGSVRTGVNAVVNALQALAGGDIKAALAQGAAPYLAAKVKEITTDNADYSTLTNTQKLNNLMAHAILVGVIAELSGGSAAAGATGAVTGELAAPAIALALYGTSDSDKLTSEQKENLSALATLASGIAAGVGSDSSSGAISGAQAGKNAVENNALSFGTGMQSSGAAAQSWNQYSEEKNLTPEQKKAGLDKLVKGDMPDGANIPKAIVEGYEKVVLAAGAVYLTPEVAIAKGLSGAVLSGGMNSLYQYITMDPNEEYNFTDATVATVTGYLAPGYSFTTNVGIGIAGTFYTDGFDHGALGGSVIGSVAGGVVGELAPTVLRPILGPSAGFISEVGGAYASEVASDATEKAINKIEDKK